MVLVVLRGILDGFRGCRTNTAHTCLFVFFKKKGHGERMSDSVVFGQLGCEVRGTPRSRCASATDRFWVFVPNRADFLRSSEPLDDGWTCAVFTLCVCVCVSVCVCIFALVWSVLACASACVCVCVSGHV